MAYQYKYDTIRGRDSKETAWGALGADFICKSTGIFLTKETFTGIFLTKETTQAIINGDAKKVVSSAPDKDDSQVVVMGVNAYEYNDSENFVLCASCTTNSLGSIDRLC